MKRKRLFKFISITLGLAVATTNLSGCSDFLNEVFGSEDAAAINSKVNEIGSNIDSWLDGTGKTITSFAGQAGETITSWTGEAGKAISNWWDSVASGTTKFFTVDIPNWWDGVVDGTVKVYDDVSGYVVNTTNKIKTSIAECYQVVKDGAITFFAGAMQNKPIQEANISTSDYELYKNDNEALVYALISNQLQTTFDVFPAYIYHPENGLTIEGIGYSDHQEVYQDEEDSGSAYFSAGFLPAQGEETLSAEDLKTGFEIYRLDNGGEFQYFYNYTAEAFNSHFIANNKYVVFGIHENQDIFVWEQDLNDDTEMYGDLGGLYDYDHKEWLFTDEIGDSNEYISVDGSVVNKELLNPVNSLKAATNTEEAQDNSESSPEYSKIGFSFTIQSLVNNITGVVSFIKEKLSELEANTFLGANISDLTNNMVQINASDVVSADETGFRFENVSNDENQNSEQLAHTIIIAATIVSALLTILCSILENVYPAFKIVGTAVSAIMGGAMEGLIETLLMKKSINEINWMKVILKAVAAGISYNVKNVFGDALVEALCESIINFTLEGGTIMSGIKTFLTAFITTLIIAGTVKLLGKIGKGIFKKISKTITKNSQKTANTATKSLAKASPDYAETLSKSAKKSASAIADSADDVPSKSWIRKVVRHMPSDKNKNFIMKDVAGNVLKKSDGTLKDAVANGQKVYYYVKDSCDPKIIAKMAEEGFSQSQAIGIFDGQFTLFSKSLANIDIGDNVIGVLSRKKTFDVADELLANEYSSGNTKIPEKIKNFLVNRGVPLDNIKKNDITAARKALSYTWHEVTGQALQLVSTGIHKSVPHAGGVSYVKIAVALNNLIPLIASCSEPVLATA